MKGGKEGQRVHCPRSPVLNYHNSTFNHSCTTPHPGRTGNITNDPLFVDAVNSNFHLEE